MIKRDEDRIYPPEHTFPKCASWLILSHSLKKNKDLINDPLPISPLITNVPYVTHAECLSDS